MKGPPRSAGLTAAVVLGWIWAVAMGALSLAAVAPAIAAGGDVWRMALPVLLSASSAAGAYLLRRGRWPHLSVGAAAAWIGFLVLVPLKVSTVGMALNVAIIGLVLTNLRRFR